jgi:superfamily II DNA/RNA helicase
VKAYSRHTPLRATVVFGGVDIGPQTAALRSGVEIVIATPGRLLDHVQQKTVNLSQTQILVMDEADRMLDMGFLPDLQRIINLLPKQRQNLMFSATFSPEIKKLANTFLKDPVTIEVARSNATAENVTQIIYKVEEEAKRDAVSHIIRERGLKQVIVFSNTKIGASRLARQLVSEGVKASAIHGDKSQGERMQALEQFKNGEVEVLVATDVAARGLDIAELPCVINFDLPYNAEDYVHRIGRTGRAGATGDAISLYSEKDARLLVDIEKLTKQKFMPLQLEGLSSRGGNRERPGERSGERSTERTGERSGRRDESGRAARSSGAGNASSSGSRIGHGSPRREKVDPFFTQPYVASNAPTEENTPAEHKSSIKPGKQKVAALLGGAPKR